MNRKCFNVGLLASLLTALLLITGGNVALAKKTAKPPKTKVNKKYTTAEGTALTIAATGVIVTYPSHGTLTLNDSGGFTYTPDAGYTGSDSFTYQTAEGYLVTVDITITPVVTNHAPVAVNDSYTTAEDTALTIAAPGVLANDTDSDGDPLTAFLMSAPVNGTLSFGASGAFTYTPAAGFSGSDAFTYQVSDGSLASGLATVALTITPTDPNETNYVIRDEFTTPQAAGTVDGTLTESGHERTVIDTQNLVSIADGKVFFDGGTNSWGNPILLYPEQQRGDRTLYLWHVTITSAQGETAYNSFECGLIYDATQLLTAHSFYFFNGTIFLSNNNHVPRPLGAYTATDYWLCIAPKATVGAEFFIKGGAFTSWTKLYEDKQGDYTTWRPYIATYDASINCDFFRISSSSLPSEIWAEGPNLFLDPGLEANYTAGKCDSLTVTRGRPILVQSSDVHSGVKAQRYTATAFDNQLSMPGFIATKANKWYRGSTYAKRIAGTSGTVYTSLYSSGWFRKLPITSADWQNYKVDMQQTADKELFFCPAAEAGASGFDTVIVDDCKVVELYLNSTTTSLLDELSASYP